MNWLLPPLPPNFAAALRDVHAQRPESRMAAAERLGRADEAERARALPGLSELARDRDPGVRATALAALGLVGGEDELPIALRGLEDEFPEVREFAALAVSQIGGAQALEPLTRALESSAPEVRFQAVAGLAELAPEQAQRRLLPLLADEDAEVRAQVVAALGSFGEPHLAGYLAGALDDELAEVRLEAALGLAALHDARAERELLAALQQRRRVGEVARALAGLGSRSAGDLMAEIARGWLVPGHLRAELGAALVQLGDARGAALLRRVLIGLRADARSYAVQLTGEVRAEDLVPELVRLLRRPRGVDLRTLSEALLQFVDVSAPARAALEELASRPDPVGESARRALANWKERPSQP